MGCGRAPSRIVLHRVGRDPAVKANALDRPGAAAAGGPALAGGVRTALDEPEGRIMTEDALLSCRDLRKTYGKDAGPA
jgi:hypothetical protein